LRAGGRSGRCKEKKLILVHRGNRAREGRFLDPALFHGDTELVWDASLGKDFGKRGDVIHLTQGSDLRIERKGVEIM